MATPKLTHVFDLIMTGPAGFPYVESAHSNLCVAHVDSGTVNLPDGTSVLRVVTASDWMTTGPTRTITIDARSSAISNDGKENMDFAYLGKMEITPEVEEVISGKSGKEMEFGDCYYYTTPRIYSRCERWAWVNDTVFVAAGKLRLEEGRPVVSYRIYKVG